MTQKKNLEIEKQFDDLTIKDQIRILVRNAAHSHLNLQEIIEEVEKTYLQYLLQENNFSIVRVALFLNLHRNSVNEKIKKYNLKKEKK